jgi:hypothetical protein
VQSYYYRATYTGSHISVEMSCKEKESDKKRMMKEAKKLTGKHK